MFAGKLFGGDILNFALISEVKFNLPIRYWASTLSEIRYFLSDLSELFVFEDEYPSAYHPPPTSLKEQGEMIFLALLPH